MTWKFVVKADNARPLCVASVRRLHSLNNIRSQGVTGAVERLTGETRSVEAATTLTGW